MVSHQSDECGLLKNLLNQCLIRSIVGEFDKEIGFNYFRGMHLSDIIPKHSDIIPKHDSFQKVQRQNIGL